MSGVKNIKKDKFVSITLILSLLISMFSLTSFMVVVYANPAPSSTLYVEAGIYPAAPTYTIWREDSTYFAKDANGEIPSWGGTSNASEIIIDASEDLSSTGGTIFFASSVFELDTMISITTKNITLTGEGRSAILKAKDNANLDALINFPEQDDADNLSRLYAKIENIKIDGNKDNNGAESGILLNETMWVTISDIYVNNCEIGIYLWGESGTPTTQTWHVLIENCKFGGYEGNNTQSIKGIYANQIVVDGNIIEDTALSGINLTRCMEWTISNNMFDDNQEYAILLNHTGDAYQYMTIIDGNTFSDTVLYHDIYIGATVWNVIISNNNLFDTYQQALNGIYVRGRYVVIDGNIIRQMYGYGIHVDDIAGISPYYITITNNIIWDCSDYGIRNEANFTTITGNVIKACTRPIRNYADHVVIKDNVFENNSLAPLFDGTVEEIVRANIGFVTENGGSASVSTGGTVSHGLAGTPTIVTVTAGEGSPTDVYLTAVGASTFAINFGGGGSKTFYWYAEYKP